jgi:hypothetical protein
VESGRYRGELIDNHYPGVPWRQYFLQGTRFYKRCITGETMMWNMDAHIQKIAEFEATLPK